MSTKTSKTSRSSSSHGRKALIQWLAVGVVVALGIVAAFLLSDGNSAVGGHSGAPASANQNL